MTDFLCSIDKNERIARLVIGVIVLLGALLGLGAWFFMIVGAALVASGVLGKCSIPVLSEKLGLKKMLKDQDK